MRQQRGQRGRTIRSHMRINIPPTQEGLVISVSAWNGFIERVKGAKRGFRPWSIAYSVLFGIGITAGLSIAPLMIAEASLWIVATYAAASATSILVGVALIFMERQLARHQDTHIHQLVSEMEHIRDESLSDGTV